MKSRRSKRFVFKVLGWVALAVVGIIWLSRDDPPRSRRNVSPGEEIPRSVTSREETRESIPSIKVKEINAGPITIKVPDDWSVTALESTPSMSGDARGYFVVGSLCGEGIYFSVLDWLHRDVPPSIVQLFLPKTLPHLPPVAAAQAILYMPDKQPISVIESQPIGLGSYAAAIRYRQGGNEGLAISIVTDVATVALANIEWWTSALYGFAAPTELFRRNAGMYAVLLSTAQLQSSGTGGQTDPGQLAQIAKEQFARMLKDNPEYQKQWRKMREVHGGN